MGRKNFSKPVTSEKARRRCARRVAGGEGFAKPPVRNPKNISHAEGVRPLVPLCSGGFATLHRRLISRHTFGVPFRSHSFKNCSIQAFVEVSPAHAEVSSAGVEGDVALAEVPHAVAEVSHAGAEDGCAAAEVTFARAEDDLAPAEVPHAGAEGDFVLAEVSPAQAEDDSAPAEVRLSGAKVQFDRSFPLRAMWEATATHCCPCHFRCFQAAYACPRHEPEETLPAQGRHKPVTNDFTKPIKGFL